jgi:hypothetical protein
LLGELRQERLTTVYYLFNYDLKHQISFKYYITNFEILNSVSFNPQQEEVRIAKDSLQRTEEAADLMAEKSLIAEQEALLLQQKATEAENELQVG